MIRSRSSLLLIGAAVVLAAAGLLLVFGGGGNDGESGGSVGGTAGGQPDSGTSAGSPAPGSTSADPTAPSATETGTGAQNADPENTEPQDTDAQDTGDEAGEPLEPSDTPTAQPTPAPRQTPTLPPGMQLPEPVAVPDPASVDGDDPTAVAVAALTAAYSFDTVHDMSSTDAMSRTETWLAAPYDSSAYDLDGLRQDVERDWDQWTPHQAFASINAIEPHTTDVDTPDTATRAERRFYVRMTPIGRDAWNGSLVEHQWFAFLERASATDEWRIVELQTPLAHR